MPDIKFFKDAEGNVRQVPTSKVDRFKSLFPNAQEATEEELQKLEMNRATENEQKRGESTDINVSVPTVDKVEISGSGIGNPFSRKGVDGAIDIASKHHRADPDIQFKAKYGAYKDNPELHRDEDAPEMVERREEKPWYSNIGKGGSAMGGGTTPQAKQYGSTGQEDATKTRQSQEWLDTRTAKQDKQQEIDKLSDFLTNTETGRGFVEYDNNVTKYFEELKPKLDAQIEELEQELKSKATERAKIVNRGVEGTRYGVNPSWLSKEQRDKIKEAKIADANEADKIATADDLQEAGKTLAELKRMRDAVNDRDKNAFVQLINEGARRIPDAAFNAATLSLRDVFAPLENKETGDLTRKATGLFEQHTEMVENLYEHPTTMAQDIANGTLGSMVFMSGMAFTGVPASAIVSGATKGLGNAILKEGTKKFVSHATKKGAGKVVRIAGKNISEAFVQTVIMPSTLAGALEKNNEEPGSFLNAYAKNFIAAFGEVGLERAGDFMPGFKFKSKFMQGVTKHTHMNSFFPEIIEEDLQTAWHALFKTGEGEWGDLIDPRNRLVTAATIGLMQAPAMSIETAGGYAAGRNRNSKAQRQIKIGLDKNVANMQEVFGEDAERMMDKMNQYVEVVGKGGQRMPNLLLPQSEMSRLTETQQDALATYTLAYGAKAGMERAKAESKISARNKVKSLVNEHVNKHTGTIIMADVAGLDGPVPVHGYIVYKPDGTIDHNKTGELFYRDADGKQKVTSSRYITLAETVDPAQIESDLAQQKEFEIEKDYANREVPLYQNGEQVKFTDQTGTIPMYGQVTGVGENGNYIVSTQTGQTTVEPRQIVPEKHLEGVENGTQVKYINENGETVEGAVTDAYSMRNNGMMVIDGKEVSTDNIVGIGGAVDAEVEVETESTTTPEIDTKTPEQLEAEKEQLVEQTKQQQAELEKKEFYDTLPRNKKGDLNHNQFTPEQKLKFVEFEYGKERAIAGAEVEVKNAEKRLKTAQTQLNNDPLNAAKIEAEIKAKEELDYYKGYVFEVRKQQTQEVKEESTSSIAEEASKREQSRAEQEEAQKQSQAENEATKGVPDVRFDTPQAARNRGFKMVNGVKYDMPLAIPIEKHTDVEIKFSDNDVVKAKRTIVPGDNVQSSHVKGVRNPKFFYDELQPKNRTDEASQHSADNIGRNNNPKEITGGVTAYTGAPKMLPNGQIIQGANRNNGLDVMYQSYPEKAKAYRQHLIDTASEYGMTPEEVSAINNPKAVDVIEVSDAEAIRLGQLSAQDTESGGAQRIPAQQTAKLLGKDIDGFVERLFLGGNDNTPISTLLDATGKRALDYLNRKGVINATQYQSALNKDGNLTPEAKADLQNIAAQLLYQKAGSDIEVMFMNLPDKAQKAILQTIHRDGNSVEGERIVKDIQEAIQAFSELDKVPNFAEAKNYVSAKEAAMGAVKQTAMFDSETTQPLTRFSNFALELAVRFKTDNQNALKARFNALYNDIQGIKADAFDTSGKTSKVEAINKHFKPQDYVSDGQTKRTDVAGDSRTGQEGQQTESGRTTTGESVEGEKRPTDSTRRVESDNDVKEKKKTVETISKQLNTEVVVYNTPEDIPTDKYDPYLEKKKASRGWYLGDKVYVILSNNKNALDVQETLLHEIVGHKGIKDMLGREKHEQLLTKIFDVLPKEVQAELNEKYKGDKYLAADEYIAKLAENYDNLSPQDKTVWEKVKQAIIDFVQNDLGIKLTEQNVDAVINALLVESKNRLENPAQVEAEGAVPTKAKAPLETTPQDYGSQNKIITQEQYTELRDKLRNKLNNLNTGFDPEIFTLGAQMAAYHIEAGAVKFKDFAQRMIADVGESVKPYLKSFYEGARLTPGFEQLGKQMDAHKDVVGADVDAIGKVEAELEEAKADVYTNPTEAQKEAGNYKKGHVTIAGLDITIENPKGSQRSGTDANGDAWSITMQNDYGYIKQTKGKDGDHIDIFVGNNLSSDKVFVVDQVDSKGNFDEHKVMLGFDTMEQAREAYLSNYEDGWTGLKDITEITAEDFKKWTDVKSKKQKAFAEYKQNGKPKKGTPINIVELSKQAAEKEKAKQEKKEAEQSKLFEEQEQPTGKIEDFGEVIEGAKKHTYERIDVGEGDIQTQPLSKTFPKPDYKKLVEDGVVSKKGAAAIKYAYDNIGSKPRRTYPLKRWGEKVQDMLNLYNTIIEDSKSGDAAYDKMMNNEYLGQEFKNFIELQEAFGFPENDVNMGAYRIISPTNLGGAKGISNQWLIVKGQYIKGEADSIEGIVKKFNDLVGKNKEGGKNVKLDVYQDTKTKDYFIGRKTGGGVIRLIDGLTRAQAWEMHKNDQAKLQEMWQASRLKPDERRKKNRDRTGKDYRDGKDVTPEQFENQFGFRGVQFGNWVNNAERQESLNDAYDAFMDLSNVMGVSPRALSLAGELGMAFGARGGGKASAHYEAGKVVINLTKTKGAGSLAHEWWHAMDNYFSRMRGNKGDFITNSPKQKIVGAKEGKAVYEQKVRKEMHDAFLGVMNAIDKSDLPKRSKELDKTRSAPYFGTKIEMSARAFEGYIVDKLAETAEQNDYLANFKETSEWGKDVGIDIKAYPYPMAKEAAAINEAFENLFDAIQEKQEGENVVLFREKQAEDIRAREDGKQDDIRFRETEGIKLKSDKKFTESIVKVYNSNQTLQSAVSQDVYMDYVSKIATGEIINPTSGKRNSSLVTKVLHHGGNEGIQQFDKAYLGKSTGSESGKLGFFFSDNENVAKSYSEASYRHEIGNLKKLVEQYNQKIEEADKEYSQSVKVVSELRKEADSLWVKIKEVFKRLLGIDFVKADTKLNEAVQDMNEKYEAYEDARREKRPRPIDIQDIHYFENYTTGSNLKEGKQTYSVILDVENPLIRDYSHNPKDDGNWFKAPISEALENKHDAAIIENVLDYGIGSLYSTEQFNETTKKWERYVFPETKMNDYYRGTDYVVFEPEQIHILGSETDIQGAKDYAYEQAYSEDIRFREGQDFRDGHGAPAMDYETLQEAIDEGGDFNLSEIITGKQELVPADYFDTRVATSKTGKQGYAGAIRYMYNTKAGTESLDAIKALREQVKDGANPAELKAKAYRAIPNTVDANKLIDGDWVSLSKDYVEKHGLARFGKGEYKIIEQDVPVNKLWWDGNDINELGYDTQENIRFRESDRPQFKAPIEKLQNRIENHIALAENESKNALPENIRERVLNDKVKDFGKYSKYDVVPVSNPIININNFNRSIYSLGVKLDPINKLHSTDLLDFVGDTGHFNSNKLKWFSNRFNRAIQPYEYTLMKAKHFATEAAQTEIMDIIKDIDHAKDYYERLSKDHSVLRTEEAPRFRDSYQQKIENLTERVVNSDIDASTVLIGNETLLDLIIRETDNDNIASDIFHDVFRAVRDYNNLEKSYPLNRRGRRPGEVDYDRRKAEITKTLNNTIEDIKNDPSKNRYARERINVINEVIKNADKINDLSDDIRFRKKADLTDAERAEVEATRKLREEMDKVSWKFKTRMKEAWIDNFAQVKVLFDTLRKNGLDIAEHNDFYLQATHIPGKVDARIEDYTNRYQKPLSQAIHDMQNKGVSHRNIENYVMLHEGLVRNERMRNEAQDKWLEEHPNASANDQFKFLNSLPEDYSGLKAIEEEVGMSAQEFIDKIEQEAGKEVTTNLWKKINAATQYSLQKQYEAGFITKADLEKYKENDRYVPLRGHDDVTAEDVYNYPSSMGVYFENPIKQANGRISRAEAPFAYIGQMAHSAIIHGVKNQHNQMLLRLSRQDKSGLISNSRSWEVNMGTKESPIWMGESAPFDGNIDNYIQNQANFEERMRELQEQGMARQSGNRKVDVGGLFIKQRQAEQHEIQVFENGVRHTVYINANPAIARAINKTNKWHIGAAAEIVDQVLKINRQMAANFTTRDVRFIFTNFARDLNMASTLIWAEQGGKQVKEFNKNIPAAFGTVKRHFTGKADLNKKNDAYFREFLMNGGMTGYYQLYELDRQAKKLEREAKKGDKRNVLDRGKSVFNAIDIMNEVVENTTRFASYMTSRESGKSVVQSIHAAKNVSVNFNQKGAGTSVSKNAFEKALLSTAGLIVPSYLFSNANIQGLYRVYQATKGNPLKMGVAFGSYTLAGLLAPKGTSLLSQGYIKAVEGALAISALSWIAPILASMVGGDDGEDEYMKQGEYDRQNNFTLMLPSGSFLKYPISHEFRLWYKLGDHAYQLLTGKEDAATAGVEMLYAVSDLLPANPLGAFEASPAELAPDFGRPFAQLATNTNFMGSSIFNEWANPDVPGYLNAKTNKKGEPIAPELLVKFLKSIDHATGGDGVKKGVISANPDITHHFMRGFAGGLYTNIMQGISFGFEAYSFVTGKGFDLKAKDTPARAFYTSKDDLRFDSGQVNREYYDISKNATKMRGRAKRYKDQYLEADINLQEYIDKIGKLDLATANKQYEHIKTIKAMEKLLPDLTGKAQKDKEKEIYEEKKKLVEMTK